MPSLRGLNISGHFAAFLVFHATWALKLDIPSDVVLGETIQVSWTPSPDDPDTMDLFLSCDGGLSYKMIASSVSTASASHEVTVPSLDIPNPSSPLSCDVQARTMDDVTVLDGITIGVATPVTVSSESTWALSESPPMSTAPVEENLLLSSASDLTTSSSLEFTPTSTSIPTISSADVTFSPSSQLLPTETSTTRPDQSFSTSSSSSTDTSTTSITTSTTSTLSSISVLPSADSPTQAPTKPIGTILGAIIGGLLGLLILALFMLFLCRRRSPRKPWSHRPSLMRDIKASLSSVPVSEDKEEALLAKEEETQYEASKLSDSDTEHTCSSSHGRYHLNGDESSYDLDIELQPMRFSESSSSILVPVLRAADINSEGEDREVQHTNRCRNPSVESSRSSTREGDDVPREAGRSWSFSPRPAGYDRISQSSNDSFDIDKMDPDMREQRRDALLERMRRVLDGEQSI